MSKEITAGGTALAADLSAYYSSDAVSLWQRIRQLSKAMLQLALLNNWDDLVIASSTQQNLLLNYFQTAMNTAPPQYLHRRLHYIEAVNQRVLLNVEANQQVVSDQLKKKEQAKKLAKALASF